MKRTFRWLAVILLLGSLVGCQVLLPTPKPLAPEPGTPNHLLNLPAEARIKCPENEALRGSPVLWEHAERPPRDASSKIGERGNNLGPIDDCTPVSMLDYEWSGFRGEFWVLVEDASGRSGWLSVEFVEFDG